MNTNFRFTRLTSQLLVAPSEGLAARVYEAAKLQVDSHLNVLPKRRDDVVFLQSPTSSTIVEVHDDRVTLNTQYFGDFAEIAGVDLRSRYYNDKFKRVLDVLGAARADIQFLSVMAKARWVVAPTDLQQVRGVLGRTYAGLAGLTTSGQIFDLTVRVSEVAIGGYYANAYVSWYQDRQMTVPAAFLQGERGHTVRDWQMALASEGLEVWYEMNNKPRLLEGKSTGTDDIIELGARVIKGSVAAVQRFTDSISRAAEEKTHVDG